MKLLFLSLFVVMSLFAKSVESIEPLFTELQQKQLLKELKSNKKISSNLLTIQKGWNLFLSTKNGIDIRKSFQNNLKIKFIITYDDISKLWAIYAPSHIYPKEKMLFLEYLEPNVKFFILANEDVKVNLKSTPISNSCTKFLNNPNFSSVLDSGISKEYSTQDNIVSVKSRYFSHYKQGLYSDTRILVIYPKQQGMMSKELYHYGSAIPKISLKFPKSYEEKTFYVFDFKDKKCYKGIFPSKKIPPFPMLKELN